MPLEEFPLLQDNTRLLRHKDTLYKVKVKYTEHTSESVPTGISRKQAHAQIENTFRALLYIIQREEELNLKPVVTENFLITVVTAPWSFTQRYGFTQCGKELKAYPLQFEFRIELRNDTQQDGILTKVATSDINSTGNAIAGSSKEATEVVAGKSSASGSRFTRSKGGRLLHDGNRVIQVDSDMQMINEAESARGSERITGTFTKSSSHPKVIDNSSVNKKERLKRKLQSEIDLSENQGVESVKLGSADKGLDVERFHNRNNSSQSVSPRYSGHRLRDRKYRKLSPGFKNVHKRQSERLRSKERLRYKDSSSEISDTGENFRRKRKKYIALDNCNNTIEVTDFNDSRHNTRDQDVDMLRDSRITEESQTENSTMRRRDGSKKDISEKPRAGHSDERKQNKAQHTKEPQSEISVTNEKQLRILKTNTELAQETKAKKHKLYTEKESPFLISNQQPNVTGSVLY